MNRPSRNDEWEDHTGWNQQPPALSGDLTTNSDLNGIANSRSYRGHRIDDSDDDSLELDIIQSTATEGHLKGNAKPGLQYEARDISNSITTEQRDTPINPNLHGSDSGSEHSLTKKRTVVNRAGHVLAKYAKFVGPGAMISVAYTDPGNFATDIAGGATYRFKLLFIVLLSNIFAIFLQSLCIKLGSVTGMNLAQNIKAHCPKWLNIVLYVFGEAAIVATDIAEVIGTAIALNLLFKLPLVAGCAISIIDVLVILFFYRPAGSVRGLRAFELFIMALVFGVVICFCFQLSLIQNTSVGEVFRGYLPSSALVEAKGLYQSCGILGATVMPHSLYLGSGMVQPRLLEYDKKHKLLPAANTSTSSVDALPIDPTSTIYRPSLPAIKACTSYATAELTISLLTFALFVNSAILIVAGASLSSLPDAANADLFTIHTLLSTQLAPAAGVVFALALLLSGTTAGIVCTLAGQMISEAQLDLAVRPWVRRLMTRSLSITPSIIIAGAVGAEGLSKALEASQVALSVILPFVVAPLVWFTCRARYMGVQVCDGTRVEGSGCKSATREGGGGGNAESAVYGADGTGCSNGGAADMHMSEPQPEAGTSAPRVVQMRNHWITTGIALLVWGVIAIMNVALLVMLGLGIGE